LIEYVGTQGDHAGQAFAARQNRHMRGRAAFGHADPGDTLRAELQQIRRGQFMRATMAPAGTRMPGFTEQRAQHPLLEVAQVVGAFGQQRLPVCCSTAHWAWIDRSRRGSPRAVIDGGAGGVEQGRVFEQCQMRGEDRFFVGLLALAGVFERGADFAAHLLQRRLQALLLFVGA
jgi:hypothetical protein